MRGMLGVVIIGVMLVLTSPAVGQWCNAVCQEGNRQRALEHQDRMRESMREQQADLDRARDRWNADRGNAMRGVLDYLGREEDRRQRDRLGR